MSELYINQLTDDELEGMTEKEIDDLLEAEDTLQLMFEVGAINDARATYKKCKEEYDLERTKPKAKQDKQRVKFLKKWLGRNYQFYRVK